MDDVFSFPSWLFFLYYSSAGHSKGIEDMDMNAVRLCFQCELEWDDGRKDSLSPVMSNPIYDKSETLLSTNFGLFNHSVTNTKNDMMSKCLVFFFSHRGHNNITAENYAVKSEQRPVHREDRDLHVV